MDDLRKWKEKYLPNLAAEEEMDRAIENGTVAEIIEKRVLASQSTGDSAAEQKEPGNGGLL